MTTDIKGHIVTATLPSWGHTKPLLALLARLIRIRPIHATVLIGEPLYPRVIGEIDRHFTEEEKDLKKLIRVVASPTSPIPLQFKAYEEAVVEVYKNLYAGKPVAARPDGELYDAVPPPNLVVLDFFATIIFDSIREISGKKVPVFIWQSACATAVVHISGPEELGGTGDLMAKIKNIKADSEEEKEKEMNRLFERKNGEVVNIPGLPPMYDHEFYPQQANIPCTDKDFVLFHANINRLFNECDGVLMQTSSVYESLEAWDKWIGARPVISVGALSPPATDEQIKKEKATPVGGEVEKFLDDALEKHGPNSVVYISFGTVWWPAEPEKIWAVVEELIELGIPFIMSHASPHAVFPEEIQNKIESSGLAYHAKWLPQQVILRHPALGWFVSHCGHNSVMEGLTAGVPLICWPFGADQPVNAALISSVHNAGFELFSIRSGKAGLSPIHRLSSTHPNPTGALPPVRKEIREVMAQARGPEGALKREKARWFKEEFKKAFEDGGIHHKELERVLDIVGR